jgi:murein DD-endopeptidase MepM/ murein hydrolase activator NlpD
MIKWQEVAMRQAGVIGVCLMGLSLSACMQQAPAHVEYRGDQFYGDKQLAALYETIEADRNSEYRRDKDDRDRDSHASASKFSSGNDNAQAWDDRDPPMTYASAPTSQDNTAIRVQALEPVQVQQASDATPVAQNYSTTERPSLARVNKQPEMADIPDQELARPMVTASAMSETKLYVVKPGETLFRISKSHGVTVQELVRLNHIGDVTEVKAGHAIRVPKDSVVRDVSTPQIAASQPAEQEKEPLTLASREDTAVPATKPQPVATVRQPTPKPVVQKVSATQVSPAGFIWPVKGDVIAQFGRQSGGLYNDGINIEAPEGSPVKAASDGTVVYAGNELQGYGNLVILRHDDGWLTAYAHNRELKVQRGDQVAQGQVIARVGRTGKVNKAQLHFGVRRGKEAKNPLDILSKGSDQLSLASR